MAYTVLQGTKPEAMDVEVLGVLHNAIGPGKDMILIRLLGAKAEYNGVLAGMSGSPVYINGKLLGAIGFRIGQFSKDPLAGVTPIAQMLEVVKESGPGNGSSTHASADTAAASLTSNDAMKPIDTPLVFDGYSPSALNFFREQFPSLGFAPVSGLGSSSPNTKQPDPVVPGSAISAVIVSGDLSVAATCTVTYVDPKKLLACGHPVTQFGHVMLPMTKAEVVGVVPSPLDAMKIINTTETVGAFTDDRQSGILGRFGVVAPMIPVTVTMRGAAGADAQTYHFSVAENPRLTPGAVTVSVYQAIQDANVYNDQSSYKMHGVVSFVGYPPVKFDSIYAPGDGTTPVLAAAIAISQRFSLIYDNPEQLPPVHSVNIELDAMAGRRTARLQDARVANPTVHVGATVIIEASLLPYRGPQRVVRIPVKLPTTLGAGTVRLMVSDGGLLDRMTSLLADPTAPPLNLKRAIEQLNQLHANDRVYVTLLAPQPQASMDGMDLPSVPLSMANVLQPTTPGPGGEAFHLRGETAVPLGSAAVDAALDGFAVVTLEVQP